MKYNPKVSIIIPVYNGGNYLKEAIDSALNQTYQNIEVIVINDGSNDGGVTEDVALSYGDKIFYYSKLNGGVASALNFGIEKMTGEFFSWLSHDDVYILDKIKHQVEYVLYEGWDSYNIIYSDYDYIDHKGNFISKSELHKQKHDYFLLNLIEDYPINGCTCLIPKIAFKIVGLFDVNLKITQDYAWWFKAYKNGYTFKYLEQVLVKSRQHDSQESKNLTPANLKEVNKLYIDYIKNLSIYDYDSQSEFRTINDWFSSIKKSFNNRGLNDASIYIDELIKKLDTHQKPRILIVGMFFSIHLRRWLSNLLDSGFQIHCFPSMDWGVNGPPVNEIFSPEILENEDFMIHGFGINDERILFPVLYHESVEKESFIIDLLVEVILKIKPHVIHAIEMQQAGYLVQQCHEKIGDLFPKWIYTNYGSDLYACSRLKKHFSAVNQVLSSADFYSCECNRDVFIARSLGYKGDMVGVLSNVGGFDIDQFSIIRQNKVPSTRNVIALKGYQHEYGRALVGLKALELCQQELRDKNMEVHIYSSQASPAVPIAAELLSKSTGIPIKIVPYTLNNLDIVRIHATARISLGLSISDAVSISFLEAMSMGSFPIQSYTACANEWIDDGITGFLVDPDDPHEISAAIKKALLNDFLVDTAARINIQTIETRMNSSVVKKQILDMYKKSLLLNIIYSNDYLSLNVVNIGDNDLYGQRFNNHMLSRYLRKKLINSHELVWKKRSNEGQVSEIASNLYDREGINNYSNSLDRYYDSHSTNSPFSFHLLYETIFLDSDIVHYHLIHNHFFNIKDMPILSKVKPTVWTLHDPWAVTGHCIHFFECERWKQGCGDCPNLNEIFKINNDTTALNWEIKRLYFSASQFDIIVASEWMKEIVSNSPIFVGKKIHVIPFGLDLNYFKPRSKKNARQIFNIPDNNFVIGCRAHDWSLKGLNHIDSLLNRIPPSKNISVITLQYKGLLDKYKDKFHIIDLGWVDDDNLLINFYNASDVFLMPSLAESFGVSAMESIACGTPVVAFDGTAVSEVLCGSRGGILVEKGNDQKFYEAVITLIDNKMKLSELSTNARQLAEEKFDVNRYIAQVIDVYHEVIAKFTNRDEAKRVITQQKKIILNSEIGLTIPNIKVIEPVEFLTTNVDEIQKQMNRIINSRSYIIANSLNQNKLIRLIYFQLARPTYRICIKILNKLRSIN